MGTVVSSASMSLDGFIAHQDNTVDPLFEWYDNGDQTVTTADDGMSFHLTQASADHWRAFVSGLGALVVGRELFDVTDGWRGNHPLGVPVVVLTHDPPTDWHYPGSEKFQFVTEGVGVAVAAAQRLAGDKNVAVAAGTIARQCLQEGLLDEVAVDLIPVVLGSGRPYFGELTGGNPRLLGDPTTVIRGSRVTHLVFPVVK